MRKADVIDILLSLVAAMLLTGGWVLFYIAPHDAMMEATQECVDEQGPVENPQDLWRPCWDDQADIQGWVWSPQTQPRKQGMR